MEKSSLGNSNRTSWLDHNGLLTSLIVLGGRERGSDASGYLSETEDREVAAVILITGALARGELALT